jgi:hypothetical protein
VTAVEDLSLEDQQRAYKRERQNACQRCGCTMTWSDHKAQYGRCLKLGLSKERAAVVSKRCQKCVTIMLREEAIDR